MIPLHTILSPCNGRLVDQLFPNLLKFLKISLIRKGQKISGYIFGVENLWTERDLNQTEGEVVAL